LQTRKRKKLTFAHSLKNDENFSQVGGTLMTVALQNLDLENTPKFRNFDWEKAKTFYYVAKCGSFMNAGRFLNISQSALSRQVISLEQHLGCPLFSRHRDGLNLTRKGEELLEIVEATFVGFKGFTRDIHAKTGNSGKRKIRIAATHADAAYILSTPILHYSQQHPELIFELIGNDQLIDIILNDVDIAIRPYDPTAQRVHQEPLFSLEKQLYASREYLKKYGEPKTVEDLKEHCLISHAHPGEHPYSDVNWILTLGMPQGTLHQPVFTSNSIECLIEAAQEGMGIIASYEKMGILQKANLQRILPEVKHKEIEGHFIYPDYLTKDKEILALKNYLKEVLC
jgi:DNA-binding transcriptional LysR family regulator